MLKLNKETWQTNLLKIVEGFFGFFYLLPFLVETKTLARATDKPAGQISAILFLIFSSLLEKVYFVCFNKYEGPYPLVMVLEFGSYNQTSTETAL